MMEITPALLWTFLGAVICPRLTFFVLFWQVGHPILGMFILLLSWEYSTSAKVFIREKIIDWKTGRVVHVSTYKKSEDEEE
jgi:hypothetical protein